MLSRNLVAGFLFLVCLLNLIKAEADVKEQSSEAKDTAEKVQVDDEKIEYARGSVCGYCEYCKFCSLCDKDCPCLVSPQKPNCEMCKYCKYCYLCSAVCDTFCKPGGYVDKVSAAIISALPFHDTKEINKDIHSMKKWIDKTKEEL
ncbi:sarcoplasmic reticulum histidine-rich calcium-binding protein [Octopus sinensis]|uniref:Sarcoplasmic reticulum histidine-rich calcium-binding protein n=1 Tax=Octopus sinensis TaxID=2607531 RepID=A0A6P7SY90_9MOLL|nr:sarcoplasmic reticulum histidine-rich calcium-binding protein [Octopus sinensis]